MRRTALTWSIFAAALVLVLTVMLFFTVKMLHFEQAMAEAEAHAALEENVRLALWRMDSAAALLLAQTSKVNLQIGNPNNPAAQQMQTVDMNRYDKEYQTSLSQQELYQRKALNGAPSGDWHKIEPALLERVSDILPGAKLEAVEAPALNPDDTRRLASIPARLVVPASALPSAALPWNTPLRVSLMLAWGCTLLAVAAVGRLLGGTLTLSERRAAFVSAVTHELRTPLTTCKMYSEMLASGMVSDESVRQQYLQTLVVESDRLGRLIDNVLAYSRLERRLSPSRARTMSVSDLVEQALPALRRRAEQAGLTLRTDIGEDSGRFSCRTDEVAVQQILINLVDNACKYGGTAIDLRVRVTRDCLELRVKDGGPGLAPAQVQRLFTAFSKSKSDAAPGIGLGLYLSRRLARDLGGELRYEPIQRGASFVLTLPATASNC